MAEASRRPLPWLEAFDESPGSAVDELFRGIADVAPYERASASDVLVTLFGSLPEDSEQRRVLDQAIEDWLLARRMDGPEHRRDYGMNRYVAELMQALAAVYRLRLAGTAHRLREGFDSFLSWLSSLSLGKGPDPALELWRIMALMQPDHRFLKNWFALCENAGRTLPDTYFQVGLLGLRRLPDLENGSSVPSGRLEREVVAGLFRWAAHLPEGPAARKLFLRRLRALTVLYPRGPNRWKELASSLLPSFPGVPFRDWLEAGGLKLKSRGRKGSNGFPRPPSKSQSFALLNRLAREPVAQLMPEIRSLMERYEHYAEATGDAEPLVLAASNFARRLRREDGRESLRLARLANRWHPSDTFTWTLWASALEALGELTRAETIYWESVRRFPEDVVSRTALAELLARTGRESESEALYRETMERFPKDVVSRTALAELLARTGRESESEALYRETMERFPKDVVSRTALAELLARTGRESESESLYRETMERFPKDVVSRNALADLLARTGRESESESLYRETTERFRHDRFAPHALAFWLLRWYRAAEAEELYKDIRARFREDAYTRHLAEVLAGVKAGQEVEVEIPTSLHSPTEQLPEALEGQESVSGTPDAGHVLRPEREASEEETSWEGVNRGDSSGHAGSSPWLADTVAEPEAPGYDADPEPEVLDPLELDPRLQVNAEVSRADLQLRHEDDEERHEALKAVEAVASADPEHIYPRLVLGLHEPAWRQKVAAEAEAFPHAYPLRFLKARESGDPGEWNALLSDFEGEHYPLTLLGRVATSNGNADAADAQRLASWAAQGNGSRQGFEKFLAERIEGWIGEGTSEAPAPELLSRLVAHRAEIEDLVGAGLRRSA